MYETNYVRIAKNLFSKPTIRKTRNANTKSDFAKVLIINELLMGHFPLLNGRKLFYKGVVGELAAFLKGPKSLKDFESQGCNYWKLWSQKDGSINVDYGNTWLDFGGINQLEVVVEGLKSDPYGRRHLISGWKPDNLASLDLPCCHYAYQWYVTDNGKLDMVWHQRSADWMIGVPSDVILAALWNILMAQTVGLEPGRITMTFGDSHIYESHFDATLDYFEQVELSEVVPSTIPTWELDPKATVFNFKPSMFKILNYNPMSPINFKLES